MTEREISRLIGDILFGVTIGAIVLVFARASWITWRNRGKGIRWVSHDDGYANPHPSVNVDGTPMINGSIDVMGNPYGSTDHHH